MKHSLEPPQKKNVIQTISSHLLEQRKEVSSAYLFGSFISADLFSDIDLGVMAHRKMKMPLLFEMELEKELEDIVEYKVDVRVLNNAPISFCQGVIHNGEIIVDRDPNLRADFEGKVLKQYFDFSHFRRRYLSEVIHAPI